MTEKHTSVVFIGTGDFGVPILEKLAADTAFTIVGVITAPDKPQGRKKILTPTNVNITAKAHNLTVFTPDNKTEFETIIRELKPDLCLLVAYGMILPTKVLTLPVHGFINIHGSVLPKYRGASPIHQALLNGDTVTGNSWTLMEAKLDAGPLLATSEVEIDKKETFVDLYKKLAQDASDRTPSVLKEYIRTGQCTMQDDTLATICSLIDRNDGEVDFESENAAEIYNKYRAYIEWPNIYFKTKNLNIKIVRCSVVEQNSYPSEKPGTFLVIGQKKLLVVTKGGLLELEELQPPSKKPMPAASFIQGYKNELTHVVSM